MATNNLETPKSDKTDPVEPTGNAVSDKEHANGDGNADIDTAEPRKPAQRILAHEIDEGLETLNRSTSGLLLVGLSGGLDVGLSLLLIAVTLTRADVLGPLATELLVANMYSIGFIVVILGRSELFTELTALAVMPYLNGQTTLKKLARLWGLIYVSNVAGGVIVAALITFLAPAMGIVDPPVFGEIARRLVEHEWWVILLSAVLAGWMMGLVSWLVAASRDTISQIFVIWLVTTAIGFAHLHHSIVGEIEVLAGIFSGQGIAWSQFFHFLIWTTIGNSIGGAVFVALVKYGHVVQSQEEGESLEASATMP